MCWADCPLKFLWPPASLTLPPRSLTSCNSLPPEGAAAALGRPGVGAPDHQRLRLRECVREQFLRDALRACMRRVAHRDEFERNHVAALVQHLEVGMLAVRTRLAPEHRRGRDTAAASPSMIDATCRCSPFRAAADTAGSRFSALWYGAMLRLVKPWKVAIPDVEQAEPHRQVRLRAARLRKCSSIACAPASSCLKTIRRRSRARSAARSRTRANSGRRPSPRSRTWSRCRTRARPPRSSSALRNGARCRRCRTARNQRLADSARSPSSRSVVNVLDAIRNSVCSGAKAFEHAREFVPVDVRDEMKRACPVRP